MDPIIVSIFAPLLPGAIALGIACLVALIWAVTGNDNKYHQKYHPKSRR